MIGAFLSYMVNTVFTFLNGLFSIFPDMPDDVSTAIADVMNYDEIIYILGWVNYYLPLDIAAAIVAIWSTGMMAYIGIKLAIRYSKALV